MMRDLQNILEIRQKSLDALKSYDGRVWKESQGELHAQNKEFPNWILLYEDSDVKECHKALAEVLMPFIKVAGEFQFTVSYKILTNEKEVFVDFLSDNAEIFDAYHDLDSLGLTPTTRNRGDSSVFESADSAR
jgi:hypothetical protein